MELKFSIHFLSLRKYRTLLSMGGTILREHPVESD